MTERVHVNTESADKHFAESVVYWNNADGSLVGPRSSVEMRGHLCSLFDTADINTVTGQHILDFGCGTGRMYDAMYRPVTYTGADISRSYLAKFRAVFGFGVPLVVLHSRASTPFYDNSFGIIIVFSVLTHVAMDEHGDYMREFHRVMTPGGLLAVSLFDSAAYGAGMGNWVTADTGAFTSMSADVGFDVQNVVYVPEMSNIVQTLYLMRRRT